MRNLTISGSEVVTFNGQRFSKVKGLKGLEGLKGLKLIETK